MTIDNRDTWADPVNRIIKIRNEQETNVATPNASVRDSVWAIRKVALGKLHDTICDAWNAAEKQEKDFEVARDAFSRRGDPDPVEREAAWCIVEEYFRGKP
jgi:hypothetical protein